ncbi:cupredoxin domain-containing protein [Chelatococcus reniformis]|nr:cupredoxin domain-containing protein [Chelatococcus reniformis]
MLAGFGAWSAAAQTAPTGAAPAAVAPAYTPTNAAGQIEVVLKDHVFTPSQIRVPAGKRTQLLIKNQDPTADEFDSSALKVEKVVGGNSEGVVRLRELDPGTYPFMGEFNPTTAQGVVIAE